MPSLERRLERLEAGTGLTGNGCPECWTPPFLDSAEDTAPLDASNGICPTCGRRPRVRAIVIVDPEEHSNLPYLVAEIEP
jgi:uncharacterized Zn finger protein (UPF0148 family)